jgi:hypothetical protein
VGSALPCFLGTNSAAILARAKREGLVETNSIGEGARQRDDTSTILSIGGNVNLGTQMSV